MKVIVTIKETRVHQHYVSVDIPSDITDPLAYVKEQFEAGSDYLISASGVEFECNAKHSDVLDSQSDIIAVEKEA
jgi:hypothetical protein